MKGLATVTRSLGLNAYRFYAASDQADGTRWLREVNDAFSTENLNEMLETIAAALDARIIHTSAEEFAPLGASAAVMVCQQHAVLGHLDQSHLAVHTYLDQDPRSLEVSCRVDFDVSTCGRRDPLGVLADMAPSLRADVLTVDYRMRGVERDAGGVITLPAVAPAALAIDGYERLACENMDALFLREAANDAVKGMCRRIFL